MKTVHSIVLVSILFIIACHTTYAQIEKDTIVASQYYQKADSLLTEREYDSSIEYFTKALPIYQKAKAWGKVASCYNNISENSWRALKLKESLKQSERALFICNTYLTNDHKEKVLSYDNIGHYYRLSSDYDKALIYFKKAFIIRRKLYSEGHYSFAISNRNIGSIYYYKSKYKIAVEYFEKALAINLKVLDPEHPKIVNSYNNIAIIYDELGEFNKALDYYNKNLIIDIKKYGEDHKNLMPTYNNIGVTYDNLEQYDNALSYYKKALKIDPEKSQSDLLINIYNNIGVIFKKKGEYDKAIYYQKKSLDIAINHLGEHHPTIGKVYMNIGISNKRQGNLKKALDYYIKALQNFKLVFGNNHYRTAQVFDNIGNLYSSQKEYDKALQYHKEALVIRKNISAKENPDVARTYANIADTYLEMGISKDALLYYNKGVTILKNLYGEKHILVGSYYNDVATVYNKQKEYAKAIDYFDKALLSNTKNINSYTKKDSINFDQYYNLNFLLESLYGKANTLQSRYLESNDKFHLDHSVLIYKNIDILINDIRQTFTNYQDKLTFAKQAKEIYQDAIATQLLLHVAQNNPQSLEKAFYYTEKSKANILKELLNDANAKKFTGLPENLVILEKDLRINRSFYQSKITEEQSEQEIDTEKMKDYESRLFDIKRKQDSLTEILENNYPKYHQFKYRNDIIAVTDIQQQLDDKTTLLEFFTGDSISYAFTISKNNIDVQELAIPKLIEEIEEFRKSIIDQNVQSYKKQASLLYNKLIAPIASKLVGDQLIIVPDGPLWHLNFDLLLTQEDKSNNPEEWSYLVRDRVVTYANSTNLLFGAFKTNQQSEILEECLAFSFSDSTQSGETRAIPLATLRGVRGDLPGTRKEIKAISDIIDGQYYYGSQAVEANFKNNASQYNILHLALHGDVDNERPENSRLYFTKSKDTIEDNLLYSHELFALDIPAELAVLSACNTGTGKIAKGEGIMSLGNAFQYAGTKSLLLSSWEVPDDTTPELIKYFYTNLKAGMNKGKALQQAKLEYLATADRYHKAPFYWGGFYLVGDAAPMHFDDHAIVYWAIGLGVLGVILFAGFWYRRRNKFN
ncbi:CHAT domain-containing protein [Aquimarina algiphila]|uniref:CHAT domain-containing protein n=1 Tax=Aquimarina algiphila TaxID=2047982 RepID=UPI00232EE550|nr:CHAT domain-containing tetratricopeptide repeat protein [Aquimarina algiphila]